MKFPRFTFSVFSLIVAVQVCTAQRLLLKDYTTQDGLPDSRVAPIIQSRDGYMWFGTQAGLTRYDGRQFINFTEAKEIPGIFGRDIFEDHTGAIWFAYSGFNQGGLTRIWNGVITEFLESEEFMGTQAGCVVEDRNHDIWVGTNKGLKRIRFTSSERNRWVIDSFPQYHANGLYVDRKGKLFFGGSSLFSYSNGSFKDELSYTGIPLSLHIRGYAFYESEFGELWIGGIFGAARIKDSIVQFFSVEDGLPERGVWSFGEDRQGNFWVGTAKGLYRLVRGGDQIRFHKEMSFGDAIVYDVCLDHEGNVWFASAPGVRKLIAADFTVDFPGKEVLSSPGIGPIQQDKSGKIYFGSRNNGLYILENNRIRQNLFTSLTITSIFPESSNRIWYGVWRGGATLERSDGVSNYRLEQGLPSNSVHAFAKTRVGYTLIGTTAGVALFTPDGKIGKVSDSSLDGLTIFDIKITSGCSSCPENIWLATHRGVWQLTLDKDSINSVKELRGFPALSNVIVYEILIDRERTMWFGTDGAGLVRYDGTTFLQYTIDDGLAGNRIYALAQDSLGLIWVGTSSGLSQFDGRGFKNFKHDQGYSEIGIHGLLVDRDGYLWVSNFPGVSKIRPQRFCKNDLPPPIYILEIEADTIKFSPGRTIKLQHDVAAIAFHYAGLSFTDEHNIRYKYILEGYDQDWSAPTAERQVRYTHLPSGDYTFKVLARNSNGIWSEQPATASFVVLPPLWEQWWFIVSCAILLSAGFYSGYRYRLKKLLEIERTRSRIAMDLHDDIGSSLTRISVMTEVAKRKTPDDIERAEYLTTIGDTARELIDSLGDIVWSVDPKHDDLQNVIRRIVQFGQETCEGSGITFETEIQGNFDEVKLTLERRRDLYLVFKEAINNIVRHSKATVVRFSVRQTHVGAFLQIEDDGVGISQDSEHYGKGLESMQERGERIGERFSITSKPNKGTCISLEIKTG